MTQNLLDRISAASNDLTKSERRVAAAILEQPMTVVSENIADLAKRAKVSEPSVFRFCKRFGANGFPDFKLALGSSLSKEPSRHSTNVRTGDSVEDVVAKVIDGTVSVLNSVERNLDTNILARVIDVVSQARRIVIFAQGMSTACASDFKHRLVMLGIVCEDYYDPSMMMPIAASMRQGELVIAISATGENSDVVMATNLAKGSGASVVAVCPEHTALGDISLLNLRSGLTEDIFKDELMLGRIAMQSIMQIVIAGVMLRRADTILELKPKIKQAVSHCYMSGPKPAEVVKEAEPDNGGLKPNEPITTVNWNF